MANLITPADEHFGRWFAFRAYNSQTRYGFGNADDADRYCDEVLNAGREINLYAAYELTAREVATERLERRDDTFNIRDEIDAR